MSTKKHKSFAELKDELDGLLAELNSADIGIDDAIAKHDQAKELLSQLQKRLDEAKIKIKQAS
ncbi:MAG: exodeoxyribonuclease VII small subunit [Patescibacteria group bacterium]